MKDVAVLLARLDRLERDNEHKRLDDLERFVGNAALSSNSGLELFDDLERFGGNSGLCCLTQLL